MIGMNIVLLSGISLIGFKLFTNNKNRGYYFYIVAVIVLLLTILGVLTYFAIDVQQRESQNYYKINQDLNGLKANDSANHKQYELVGKGK